MALELDQIYQGDCLEVMGSIPDNSIDLIICDPPYGITENKWDATIPFEDLWSAFERIVKDHTPIVMFGVPPFSSQMIVSNPDWYRYSWVWDKVAPVGFLNANHAPLRRYEVISVFSKKSPTYYPQMTRGATYKKRRGIEAIGENYGNYTPTNTDNKGTRYPMDIIQVANSRVKGGHPTQKPVPLIEYLIRTYTVPGDVVLDPVIGSGTTAVACINTSRRYIGIELDPEYYKTAVDTVKSARNQKRLSHYFPCDETLPSTVE